MKQKYLLDTNVLLRYVLKDHKSLSLQAGKYFHLAESGQAALTLTSLTLAEFIWVLKSVYNRPVKDIYVLLIKILSHKNVAIAEKDKIISALKLAQEKNVAFIDAVNYLEAKQNKITLITFDKKLAGLKEE